MAENTKSRRKCISPPSIRSPSAGRGVPRSPGLEDGLHLPRGIPASRPKDPKMSAVLTDNIEFGHSVSRGLSQVKAHDQRVLLQEPHSGYQPLHRNPVGGQNHRCLTEFSQGVVTHVTEMAQSRH